MERFRNRYRISSHRKPGWDYSDNGLYFITLVTQRRVCNLGIITDGEMTLSGFGQIVKTEWEKSFNIRNELFLDEYVIMPNHIHAIVILNNIKTIAGNRVKMDNGNAMDERMTDEQTNEWMTDGRCGRDARPCVSTAEPFESIESLKSIPIVPETKINFVIYGRV